MKRDVEQFVPFCKISYALPFTKKHLIYGAGAHKQVGNEVKRLGGNNASVLLITDKGVGKAGLADQIKESIHGCANDIEVEIFDDITSEPTLESVQKVINKAREGKFDAVVGVGGGSVMDHAKTAAIMATNPGEVTEYMAYTEDRVKVKALPKILIPTTAGTGSEVSAFAVITDKNGVKNFIASSQALADVAIVDPLMTITCPPMQTAGSGMDALAHALENLLNTGATPFSDAFCLQAVRLVSSNLRIAVDLGDNVETRYNMAIAATLGGLALGSTPSGANIGHCIAEVLGPKYKIPHGMLCGLITPYMMDFNFSPCIDRLAMIAQYLGEDISGMSKRDAARKAIESVITLQKDIGLPTNLKQLNVPRKDLRNLAKYIVEERQNFYLLPTYQPRKLTLENVTELLEKMWEGRIS
jgi:alcohol dehydrogenase